MQKLLVLGFVLLIRGTCVAQEHGNPAKFPSEVVIARDSFIDIGPPFNYYDLTFLRAEGETMDVERVSLNPPADACYPRAEIKTAHVVLHESLPSVMQFTNPCDIPEKALKAELKRRHKRGHLVFSGMNVTIEVQCAAGLRTIRADILDRDIFDEHPSTPKYTAWSHAVFEKLDKAAGDNPWDTPVFAKSETMSSPPSPSQSTALQAISDGKYDAIFGDIADRPSKLYRLAQNPPRQPFIELTKSDPVRPNTYMDPTYPPIAKAAHVNGTVEFHLAISAEGAAKDVTIDSGPKMLWQTTSDAIAKWKFSPEDSGKVVQGSIRFGLNCASEGK